jgi:hypothetical protein
MDETEPLREEQRYNQLMSSSMTSAENATAQDEALLGSRFECNICLDDVREPIVTQCGHLYCWYAIYIHSQQLLIYHFTCNDDGIKFYFQLLTPLNFITFSGHVYTDGSTLTIPHVHCARRV